MNIIYITVLPYEISEKKQKLKLNVKKKNSRQNAPDCSTANDRLCKVRQSVVLVYINGTIPTLVYVLVPSLICAYIIEFSQRSPRTPNTTQSTEFLANARILSTSQFTFEVKVKVQ